ncbi:hypothetical protein [Roseicella sp. DB1501]|uniref:hypothetical protein n=1 Tax=Roseicella sp. DB1501 TaxID=2730925 RepID=UPI0014922F0E|nr:hypothetical protein [Roseicella sp. DB1501]NOG71276.1 hypothetical protein [Roseicella sp. DB1501]
MIDSTGSQGISLADALSHWCDSALQDAVRQVQANLSNGQLRQLKQIRLAGGSKPEKNAELTEGEFEDCWTEAKDVWTDLLDDFRGRVRDGQIYLSGVRTQPNPETERVEVPSVWIFDLTVDVAVGAVSGHGHRFTAVRVSSHRLDGEKLPPLGSRITVENVGDLTDDEILLLLEEHAKRVIAGPDAKLIAPGKISLLPIVKGKMRARAENGELCTTLAAEASALEAWIRSKVTLHQFPTAKTIEKTLGNEYKALKQRSTAEIQKSNP